LINLKQLRGLK